MATKKTKPAPQSPKDFAAKVESYPDDCIQCRDFGHSWRPVTASQDPVGNIKRILECVRCEATRSQTLDRYGYILTNSYGYQPGYLIPGMGRLTAEHRATIRITNIFRKSAAE